MGLGKLNPGCGCCGCTAFTCTEEFNRVNLEITDGVYDLPLGKSRTFVLPAPVTVTEFVGPFCRTSRNYKSYGDAFCGYTSEPSDGGIWECEGREMELATPVVLVDEDECIAVTTIPFCYYTAHQRIYVRPGLYYEAEFRTTASNKLKLRLSITAVYLMALDRWGTGDCDGLVRTEPVADPEFWTGAFNTTFFPLSSTPIYEYDGVVTHPPDTLAQWLLPQEIPGRSGRPACRSGCGWLWQKAVFETEWETDCSDFYADKVLMKISDTGPQTIAIPKETTCVEYYGSGSTDENILITGPDLFDGLNVAVSMENV